MIAETNIGMQSFATVDPVFKSQMIGIGVLPGIGIRIRRQTVFDVEILGIRSRMTENGLQVLIFGIKEHIAISKRIFDFGKSAANRIPCVAVGLALIVIKPEKHFT